MNVTADVMASLVSGARSMQQPVFRPDLFVVAVEGIIGAGKTTVTKALHEALGLVEVPEPVEDNPFLDHFYRDQATWAFPMQMWMVNKRATSMHDAACEHKRLITDRSLIGDLVFARMHKANGNIPRAVWPVYREFWATANRLLAPVPDVIVFLDVAPSVAMQRIHQRGRASEVGGITLDYLQALTSKYREVISALGTPSAGTDAFRHSKIERFTGDISTEDIIRVVQQHANAKTDFVAASIINEAHNNKETGNA